MKRRRPLEAQRGRGVHDGLKARQPKDTAWWMAIGILLLIGAVRHGPVTFQLGAMIDDDDADMAYETSLSFPRGRLPYEPPTLTPSAEKQLQVLLRSATCRDKEPMLRVLAAADVELDSSLCEKLPKWQSVVDLYGQGPVILGLETCSAFRDRLRSSARDIRSRPRLAGLWNTGTTALSQVFLKNMDFQTSAKNIAAATVPWGKHTPLYLKYINTYPENSREQDIKDYVLPVVVVRDPLRWMSSMCRLQYGSRWHKGLHGRCPNLLPTEEERQDPAVRGLVTYPVNATNFQSYYNYVTNYESLADVWSSWNGDYLHADFPRLLIRMEDTIFYPEQVVRAIGACAGMSVQSPFQYQVDQGKEKSSTNLVSAMAKYGSSNGRLPPSLTRGEWQYLQTALDPQLLQLLEYPAIEVP